MPEQHDAEHELDDIIARVVDAAGADAPAPPTVDRFTGAVPVRGGAAVQRRWLPLAAAALVAGVLLAGVVIATRAGDRSTVRRTVSTGWMTPVVPAEALPSTSPAPAATSTLPSTSQTPVAGSTRPIIEPSRCSPLYAREGVAAGVSLFARPSSLPIPIQVIADPAAGPAGPFALVQRYFADERTSTGPEAVTIGGITFWIGVYPNGNGQVEWDVGDGSQGYLRSRGLDRDDILTIVSALSARPADAPVPGFDYAPTTPDPTLQLLHEQMNTDVNGEVHRSACQSPATGLQYRVSAISGDPVFQYGGVIDRPVPLDVGVVNGTLIVIDGPQDASQPTTADVVDATAGYWSDLTARSEYAADTVPRHDVTVGQTVSVDLKAVVDDTPTSTLTLQVVESQGVAILQWDTANAVLAADAILWKIDIEGRGHSLRSAGVGGVSGHRIGDAPFTGEINLTITVIDGGDFTLQTTGPIQLVVS